MYLTNALILESGPLKDLELEFEFDNNGLPKPMILVGKNGSGKSNLLSFVTDALVEIAAKKFTDVAPHQPTGGHTWIRLIGGATIRAGSTYELALMKFAENDETLTYVSKGGRLNKQDVQDRLGNFPQAQDWPPEGNVKFVNGPEISIERIFRQGCYVNFPSGRSEVPYWSTNIEDPDNALFNDRFQNWLRKPISVVSSLKEIKSWLVDVLLDQMIDAAALQYPRDIAALINQALMQHTALMNFNSLVRTILGAPNARLVRAGRQAGSRKLMIVNEANTLLLPSLDFFSSGQAMLISIFGTILRYADVGRKANPTQEMLGIVSVDEVDAHLHADLQHDTLPQLMRLFPKIQFIVTAHSPLFPLGMEKHFGSDGFSLVELPIGTQITSERYGEFQSSFQYLKQTKLFDETVITRASELERPLVLCEGPTDPKYLRTAADLLGFDYLTREVDFDWVGVMADGAAKDGGEGQLRQARKTLQNNPSFLKAHTILLFDCDQNDREIDQGLLHVRVLLQQENIKCDKGIENLLPAHVFEDRFFSTTVHRDGPNEIQKKTLDKVQLCNYLCDEKRAAADFGNFRPSLEILQQAVRNGAEEIAQQG